jgi:hypothetical protein
MFAFGGVGFAGVTTQGEKDFDQILASPSAEASFEKLLATGSPEAKSYSLVAIRRLNPEKFKTLSAPFADSKVEVHTAQGCILAKKSLAEIVKNITAGAY